MSALARTSSDTFIFMAGDTCHFPGTFRPSHQLKLPNIIPPSVTMKPGLPTPTSSSCFTCFHPCPSKASSTPFYEVSQAKGGWYVDPPQAQTSVTSLQEFDGDENVLVLIAHDPALLHVKDLFPSHSLNTWQEKGLKEKLGWNFLNELPSRDTFAS